METTNSPPELNVNDLVSITQLIDLSCRRGAFQANEMKTVGELYDKLVAFTEGVVAAQQNVEADATQADAAAQGDTNA
jgi:hypothetical protein